MVLPLIIGAITAASSAIVSAVSTIGVAVSSFAASVGPMLADAIQTLKPLAEAISKFANAFLQNLSILKPGETIESMGERALQAAAQGIKLENSDSFVDYMQELRDLKLDPELEKNRSPAEKLLAGISIATIGLEDKFNANHGSFNGVWLLPLVNPQYFTPERMQSLITTGRLGNEVLAYLNKALSPGETRNLERAYEATVEHKSSNGAEIDKLYDELHASRDAWANISKQIEEGNQR
ncbi:MAG: hypothetical protein PHI64_19695 [Zoogloea sp.]|uniref:hypothetical protein n=1 Tax=Zoogloea sp. TaxID=49181 RepID=UPI002635FEB0|nr:hypothetical protein [Zoogloea sp.]MDD2991164.1 hypothetical protein [Zoogloea sp.]